MKGPSQPASPHRTLAEALAKAARTSDGRSEGLTFVDLDERERTLSFASLFTRARRAAAAMATRGVERGDRVVLAAVTSEQFTDAFFGALLCGAVPVPVYPPVRLARLDEYHRSTAAMIRAVEARLVVADRTVRSVVGPAVERARPALGCLAAEALAQGTDELERELDPEDLGLIQFSSGSTVDPKPVALTHAQLLAQLSALKALLPDPGGGRPLGVSWLPLYHDMGLIGCLLLAVHYPGPLVLIRPDHFLARPALWLRALSRHRGTFSAAPNFAYALCTQRIRPEELEGVDLSAWRLALNGAEPVSPAVLRRFADRFAACGLDRRILRPVYGLSEAALAVTFTPERPEPTTLRVDPFHLAQTGEVASAADFGPAAHDRELASVGSPIPGVELEIRSSTGATLPEDRVGRIVVRGPSVMTGYFGAPTLTARTLRDGWLDTGDLGFVHRGELYVCGRAKDVIVLRGANHTPAVFEDCLAEVPGVRVGCAAAVGFTPPGADGEELLLLVERARAQSPEGDGALADAVRDEVLRRTGIRAHTVRILEAGTLPRTSSGKLRRQEALRRCLTGELTPARPLRAWGLAAQVIRSHVALARVGRGDDV